MSRRFTPTFRTLTRLEPRLDDLLREAQAVRPVTPARFCANDVWYGSVDHDGLKPRLLELVGWERAGEPVLETPEAYDCAYETIYDALPACHNCDCFGVVVKRSGRKSSP